MENFFTQQIDRARRYQHPISVFIIDIDCFKNINDLFGHQVGDEILRQLASSLDREMRTSGFNARYGGEEFVVILPETALDTGFELAERVRLAIAEINIAENQKLHPQVSIGVATYPKNWHDYQTLLREADKALYDAKRNGRNTVRYASVLKH